MSVRDSSNLIEFSPFKKKQNKKTKMVCSTTSMVICTIHTYNGPS